MPSKVRAEVLSQRVEMMTEQFGLSPCTFEQAIRSMFMYGFSILFPSEAGTQRSALEKEEDGEMESFVEKEGIHFINPHPTRTFYDNSAPISAINTNLGPILDWVLGYS